MDPTVPAYMVATPGEPSSAMLQSLMAMEKPPGTVFHNIEMSRPGRAKMSIAEARNAMFRDFLRAHELYKLPKPLNWLFSVDGDCVVHPLTLRRLQSWKKPLVAPLGFTRYRAPRAFVYAGLAEDHGGDMRSYHNRYDWVVDWLKEHGEHFMAGFGPAMIPDPAPEDSLHAVDWLSTHCYLIHRRVIEKVAEPWFEMASDIKWGSGSDRLFGEKCKALGIEQYADFSVVVGHEARFTIGAADFIAYLSVTDIEVEADSPLAAWAESWAEAQE